MNRMMPPAAAVALVQHALKALLKLAAIFRAGDERAHIKREQLLVADRIPARPR